VSGLRSNWGSTVRQALWGSHEHEDDALEEAPPSSVAPAGPFVSLEVATVILGMPRGEGETWRRRTIRRLRTVERELGSPVLIVRRGRRGTVVRLEALRRLQPIALAALDRLQEMSKRSDVDELLAVSGSGAVRSGVRG